MNSIDRWQVSHIILELEKLLDALHPATLVNDIRRVIEMVADPPPGDPRRLRELAGAFHSANAGAQPLATEVREIGAAELPEVWQGLAGATASQVVLATAADIDEVRPAFGMAESALREYAETVERLRKRHGDLRQRLYDAWHDLSHVKVLGVEVDAPDLGKLQQLQQRAVELMRGCIQLYSESLSAADLLAGRFADIAGRARAGPARDIDGKAATAVLLAETGIDGLPTQDNAIVSPAQAGRAAQLRDGLSPEDRARLDAVLAGAASPQERAYLLKAFAAGHSIAEVEAFGKAIAGKDPDWLRRHLSLVDPGDQGDVAYVDGQGQRAPVRQFDGTTCGSTSIVVARASVDPMYAWQLTTAGTTGGDDTASSFATRLREEEQRTHDSTNTVWPQSMGTTPWGVSGELNDHSGQFGTGYDWRLVDDTTPGSVNPALREAVTAADRGYPVPVLIGDGYPAHYVVLIGHDGSDLLFYEPSNGEVVRVSESDFRNGNMSALGYRHVQAVVTPNH